MRQVQRSSGSRTLVLSHFRWIVSFSCPSNLSTALLSLLLTLSFPSSAASPSLPPTQPAESTCPIQEPTLPPQLMKRLTEAMRWVREPSTSLEMVLTNLAPLLTAYVESSPWPEIHEKAQQARVPVMMYHDILPEKEVFFDVTPEEFEEHLQLIQESGLTPISLDQLIVHLQTGLPLPEKPILLTFDDGYRGHYEYVYPLLRKYGYPAAFSIYTDKVGRTVGRPGVTWEHLREMAADPLVTIISHTVSHPQDLRTLSEEEIRWEVVESKQILAGQLDIPIRYFTYPTGYYNETVAQIVQEAGYQAALTMDDYDERFAGASESLLAISRFGQSALADILPEAWGGPRLASGNVGFDFTAPVALTRPTVDGVPLLLISGGRPITIHADSRYQVQDIIAETEAIAAVDGGFFSLEFLDSNVMIGPVLSQNENRFVPGNRGENPKLKGRPLVLISPQAVRFVPFDPERHNTLAGVQAEMATVTDAFVAAAWLVKNGQPQPARAFNSLFDYDAYRHRAFWGINQSGQPVIGVTADFIDSVSLGEMLAAVGLQDAVMLDSGASTSLAYEGDSLVGYVPRPVPHVVALVPPNVTRATCIAEEQAQEVP